MPTKTVDVHDAESQLAELVAEVLAGAEIILTDGVTPLVRLAPLDLPGERRIPGLNPGAIWTSDDFDEPLPDEFWLGTA